MNFDIALNVAEIADDGMLAIDWTYERVRVLARGVGQENSYDTAAEMPPDDGNPLAILRGLIGRKIRSELLD